MRSSSAAALLALSVLATSAATSRAGDFDNDGFDDLAVASMNFDAGATRGLVHILRGSAIGLLRGISLGNLTPDDFQIAGDGAKFGAAMVCGDFDGDGYDDLAVGAPGATISDHENAGCVVVVPGGPFGLDSLSGVKWAQDSPGIADSTEGPTESELGEEYENFGRALAAADFDGDGYDDLAIGVNESVDGAPGAGAFHVLRGSSTGLTANKSRFFTQDSPGVKDQCEEMDHFAFRLRGFADIDGDGFGDLMVQTIWEQTASDPSRGAVSIFFGSKKGLTARKNRIYRPKQIGHVGEFSALYSPTVGTALECADFDQDGRNDVVIGLASSADGAGAFALTRASKQKKLDLAKLITLDETTIAPDQLVGESANFGWDAAAADFDGDGFSDLAVSAVSATVGGTTFVGRVQVLRGGPQGLHGPVDTLAPNSGNVPGAAQAYARFGDQLVAQDFNGDGRADLAIGMPDYDVSSFAVQTDAGVVIVLYGGVFGVESSYGTFLTDPAFPTANNRFGYSIAR